MSESVLPVMNSSNDEPHVLFSTLPETLEWTGEFGAELLLFLPFCNWLSKVGLLKNKRIKTYRGMKCFYESMDCLEIIEKTELRYHVPAQHRPDWLPIKNEHDFDGKGRSPFHLYPDFRRHFKRLPLIPEIGFHESPLLVVHNKHNNEWGMGPINHIPLDALEKIFKFLKTCFTVVYIRHGIGQIQPDFSDDHNEAEQFADRDMLSRHPEVLCFDDLYAKHISEGGRQDFNTFKNVLYSRCHHFISSQGGGAHHIALFSASILLILHRQGSETQWAYRRGYYGFISNPPPVLALCSTADDLADALPLLPNATTLEDILLVDLNTKPILARFSPKN